MEVVHGVFSDYQNEGDPSATEIVAHARNVAEDTIAVAVGTCTALGWKIGEQVNKHRAISVCAGLAVAALHGNRETLGIVTRFAAGAVTTGVVLCGLNQLKEELKLI